MVADRHVFRVSHFGCAGQRDHGVGRTVVVGQHAAARLEALFCPGMAQSGRQTCGAAGLAGGAGHVLVARHRPGNCGLFQEILEVSDPAGFHGLAGAGRGAPALLAGLRCGDVDHPGVDLVERLD